MGASGKTAGFEEIVYLNLLISFVFGYICILYAFYMHFICILYAFYIHPFAVRPWSKMYWAATWGVSTLSLSLCIYIYILYTYIYVYVYIFCVFFLCCLIRRPNGVWLMSEKFEKAWSKVSNMLS